MRDEAITHLVFLLDLVEVVYDDTDEQVDDKLRTDDHERYEVECRNRLIIFLWLFVYPDSINAVIHDIHPALRSHHLEQR